MREPGLARSFHRRGGCSVFLPTWVCSPGSHKHGREAGRGGWQRSVSCPGTGSRQLHPSWSRPGLPMAPAPPSSAPWGQRRGGAGAFHGVTQESWRGKLHPRLLLKVNCKLNDPVFPVLWKILKVIGTLPAAGKALYRTFSPGLVMNRYSPVAGCLVSVVLKQILLKIPFL